MLSGVHSSVPKGDRFLPGLPSKPRSLKENEGKLENIHENYTPLVYSFEHILPGPETKTQKVLSAKGKACLVRLCLSTVRQ